MSTVKVKLYNDQYSSSVRLIEDLRYRGYLVISIYKAQGPPVAELNGESYEGYGAIRRGLLPKLEHEPQS